VIGILYICTGKYQYFWEKFYSSSEKKFLPNLSKKYFVFTDKPWKYWFRYSNVVVVYTPKTKWPFSTLLRFKYFVSSKKKLQNTKYLYFFNANIIFQDIIGFNFLPGLNDDFVAVKHPGFYDKSSIEFTYERNPNSTAFIPEGEGNYYFMGGVNGGKTKEFLNMCEQLYKNINIDLQNGLIALWHDESHLNCFFNQNIHRVKVLDPDYGFPEDWNIPFEPKILILDKAKFGGHKFLRNE
jgi:hypothetical protein